MTISNVNFETRRAISNGNHSSQCAWPQTISKKEERKKRVNVDEKRGKNPKPLREYHDRIFTSTRSITLHIGYVTLFVYIPMRRYVFYVLYSSLPFLIVFHSVSPRLETTCHLNLYVIMQQRCQTQIKNYFPVSSRSCVHLPFRLRATYPFW